MKYLPLFGLLVCASTVCEAQIKTVVTDEVQQPSISTQPIGQGSELKSGTPLPPIKGSFRIQKIRKHKTYIAIYAAKDNEIYKIVGDLGSPLNKLRRHQHYNMEIQSVFCYPAQELVTTVRMFGTYVSVEPRKHIYEIYTLKGLE